MSSTENQVVKLASRLRMDEQLFLEIKESKIFEGYSPVVVQAAIALCEDIALFEQYAPYFREDKL